MDETTPLGYDGGNRLRRSPAGGSRRGRRTSHGDSVGRGGLIGGELLLGAEFAFRAEYLAMMLGLQSDAVAEPMAALQAIGAVRYGDDVVRIVSERRLREAACECYAAPVDLGRRLTLARPRAKRDAQ